MRPAKTTIHHPALAPPPRARIAPLRWSANCALPPSPPQRKSAAHLLRLGRGRRRGRWLGQLLPLAFAVVYLTQRQAHLRKSGDRFVELAGTIEIALRKAQFS